MCSWPLLIVTLLGVRAGAQPGTLAGFSDKGAFILYANEERVARLTFQWKADGTFNSEITIYHDAQHPSYILLPLIPEK